MCLATKQSKYNSEIRRSAQVCMSFNSLMFKLKIQLICVKFIFTWDEFQLLGTDLLSEKAPFLPGHVAWHFNFLKLKLAVDSTFSIIAKFSLLLLTFFQEKATLIYFYFVLLVRVFSYD